MGLCSTILLHSWTAVGSPVINKHGGKGGQGSKRPWLQGALAVGGPSPRRAWIQAAMASGGVGRPAPELKPPVQEIRVNEVVYIPVTIDPLDDITPNNQGSRR